NFLATSSLSSLFIGFIRRSARLFPTGNHPKTLGNATRGHRSCARQYHRQTPAYPAIVRHRSSSGLILGFGVALGWPWGGLVMALGWLCTPESMPSICLVYGFVVAFGGFGWICRPWEGGSPDPQSERGPEPGFPVCAPSPSKRHTLIQAGPPHPKSGKCPRECGGFVSRPAATLKLAITSPIGVAQSQSGRAGRFQSGGRFPRSVAN